MQESYESVRKCVKVKGRVELKIDKTQSKDLLAYFYRVIVLTSQVATFVPGQRCQGTES